MSSEGRDKYFERMFGKKPPLDEETFKKQKKALNIAHDIRKFEIELYWKRATYFWAFQVAIFAGLVSTLKGENPIPFLPIFFSFLGFIASVAWLYVNKGAKFWHENWELHVDLLEKEVTGNLHKNILCYEKNKDNTFSVSRINVLMSFTFLMVWALLLITLSMPDVLRELFVDCLNHDCLKVILFVLLIVLICATHYLMKKLYRTKFDTSKNKKGEDGESLDVYDNKLWIRTRKVEEDIKNDKSEE